MTCWLLWCESINRSCTFLSVGSTVYFWQSFCKFLIFDTQKLAKKETTHQLTRTTWIWTCTVTCEEKNHTSIDTLKIEMARTTRHVTLRWHFKRKYRCELTFIFVFKNVMWHFRFEVKQEMKIFKHTHWLEGGSASLQGDDSPLLSSTQTSYSLESYRMVNTIRRESKYRGASKQWLGMGNILDENIRVRHPLCILGAGKYIYSWLGRFGASCVNIFSWQCSLTHMTEQVLSAVPNSHLSLGYWF